MDQIANRLNRLAASLWLVPAAMSLFSVLLAWLLLFSGMPLAGFNEAEQWWLFSGDAGTARNLLSSLLSGMITMTSLVVSITMVVLSLAAGQLGPRLISNFMSDREIQVVLGLFMATIVYILFVLRSINDELGANHVPHIAITVASVLSMACLFALLFYVHKLARSIIADTVVAQIAAELHNAVIRARSGDSDCQQANSHETEKYSRRDWVSIGKSGYVQVIEYNRLVDLAAKEGVLVRMNIRAGHFVLRGGNHLELLSNEEPRAGLADDLQTAFVIGTDRTPTQDLEYSIRQLVEIGLRALSSGINDTFTALAVVNQLGAGLESASRHPPPPLRHFDHDGYLRVLEQPHDFAGLVDASFNQIRQSAAQNAAVLIQMSRIIGQLALVVQGVERRNALLAHLDKLERSARRNLGDPADIDDFAATADVARKRLAATSPPETLMPGNSS